jgi:hypothetical protein
MSRAKRRLATQQRQVDVGLGGDLRRVQGEGLSVKRDGLTIVIAADDFGRNAPFADSIRLDVDHRRRDQHTVLVRRAQ